MLALAVNFAAPVYAHTTLGNLNGTTLPYRSNDNELNPTNTWAGDHVPGPLGYVWPGSGLNTYSGISSNPPGYQSPFTTSENPTQVTGHAYAPEGAILTSTINHDSIGDLIFAINFSKPCVTPTPLPNCAFTPTQNFVYDSIAIYIPAPVFDKNGTLVQDGFEPAGGINWDRGENTNIVTTITDNYENIFLTRADSNDPFEPGSWILYITAPIMFTAANKWSEWYYIRVNEIRAPHVAGRYFFKIFLDNHYPVRSQNNALSLIGSTMPMENWPVLLVKGEVDPAIIWGTVLYGDKDSAFYGLPLNLPGRVRAVGVATDPLSGLSTGRAVEARGYFNSTSQGHFEVEGVAPGIYTIYASASGYPEKKIAENVKVFPGQSLRLDAYLQVGPQLKGEVFSRNRLGSVPWSGQLPITVVVYDSDTYDPDSVVTYSPTNLTDAPYSSYVVGNTTFTRDSGRLTNALNALKLVSFPWENWNTGYYPYTNASFNFKDQYGIFNGVGPAQYWWVDPQPPPLNPVTGLGSTGDGFLFQFGSKSAYGVPTKMSGMVPEVFATWTDSLTPGRKYYVRVFVNGYVQSSNDGTRLIDYTFQVSGSISSQDVFIPITLQKSGCLNVTVHFHDTPGTLQDSPIRGPDPRRFLIVEAFARDGTLAALNFTQVSSASNQASISLNGFGMAGPIAAPDPRASIKYSLARYRGIYDYGLLTDTYTIRVFMRGYVQALPPATSFDELDQSLTATISIGSGCILLSMHMYRGGGIDATVYSVDWESPPVQRNWLWNHAPASALVYDIASKAFIDVIYFWNNNTNQWAIPEQNSQFSSIPWPSIHWQSSFGPGASFLVTNGSTIIDRYGPDLPDFPSLDPSQDRATVIFLQENFQTGFLYSSSFYRTDSFRSNLAIYPGVYALNVWTYGYVQDNVATLGDLGNVQLSVPRLGSLADANVKLVTGVNLTIRMVFKTEGLFSGIPCTSSVRIRVFDDGDDLVAATTVFSDAGTLMPSSAAGFFADGKKLLSEPIPAGTKTLEYVSLAGQFGYVDPSTGSANVRFITLFPPDHGIWGRSTHPGSYSGDWTVMVDVVNWYLPNKFYPAAPALLQGESSYFYPYNHLGPYHETGYARISNVAQGGEASVEFGLDLRGYVQGAVFGLNWDDATRTMSWASLQITNGSTTYNWHTWDGWFDGYLDPGAYQAKLSEWTNHGEGHQTSDFVLNVSAGQIGSETILLPESKIAIPEFTSILPVVFVTTSVVLAGLRSKRARRRNN